MTVSVQARNRPAPPHEPGPIRARLRQLEHRAGAPKRWLRNERLWVMARTRLEKAGRWRGRSVMGWGVVALSWLGVAGLVFRLVVEVHPFRAGATPIADNSWFTALSGLLTPFALAGAGYLFFLLWRMTSFRGPYRREAIGRPQDLVQTAGTILGTVVGRDDLCHAIMEDLRDGRTRRPHVIVGGVGSGKTAMLVRLTALLAQKGAVPVPVRLRDCRTSLNFRQAAHERFCEHAELFRFSQAETDRLWQQLCNDNKIVVLADGLEEAVQDLGVHDNERDNIIRLAIHRARLEKLPLVIASRPHTPLYGMEASITELEPLSERDALGYLRRRGRGEDDPRLQWIVESADVSESPLYLQVADELRGAGLLHHISPRQDRGRLDTRKVDRMGLRFRLLETWLEATTHGYLHGEVPLDRRTREATVEQLAALACIGLRMDSLYVRFSDFVIGESDVSEVLDDEEKQELTNQQVSRYLLYRQIHEELDLRLRRLKIRRDLQLAATYGQQLGLVEPHRDGIRFPHSIMQAFLGSKYLGAALGNSDYAETALKSPGREFLMALVMYVLRRADPDTSDAMGPAPDTIIDTLLKAAHRRSRRGAEIAKIDAKTWDLYSHAAQIVPETKNPGWMEQILEAVRELADVAEKEPTTAAGDPRTLDAARLQFAYQIGEAVRRVGEAPTKGNRAREAAVKGAYGQMLDLAETEPSYPVRLALAQEIGAGGDMAFAALRERLAPPERRESRDDNGRADEIRIRDERRLRGLVLRAWLAPLLVGSVTVHHDGGPADARQILERWRSHVADTNGDKEFSTSLRIALAQGFKYAANRRRWNPYSQAGARTYLAEQAKLMMHSVDFWYCRVALLHALTLWSLPDEHPDHRSHRSMRSPDTLVRQWLQTRFDQMPGPARRQLSEHPFVQQASEMCILALESGQPERFIWIDESGVLSKAGSGPSTEAEPARRDLWISLSTGWSALDPRAQQLVADVLVMLNLAEGGDRTPDERERRLAVTDTSGLPSCLTKDRSPLDPLRTVGAAGREDLDDAPTNGCLPGCGFDLCPYPAKGQQPPRAELSEAFCRRQRVVLRVRGLARSQRLRATAPWQGETRGQLRSFWEDMGRRSRQ